MDMRCLRNTDSFNHHQNILQLFKGINTHKYHPFKRIPETSKYSYRNLSPPVVSQNKKSKNEMERMMRLKPTIAHVGNTIQSRRYSLDELHDPQSAYCRRNVT